MQPANTRTIADLSRGETATITGFSADTPQTEIRLREVGFAEGDRVCILHKGLFGSPLNVKLHSTSIAMRPAEARMIKIAPQ